MKIFPYPGNVSKLEHEVRLERKAQDAKWGPQNHPDGTGPQMLVMGRSAYDLANGCKALNAIQAKVHKVSWAYVLLEEVFEALSTSNPLALYEELTQTEAVCRAWREALLHRRTKIWEEEA